ncbi:hypothetical protein K7472_03870 [Streptomyces sp. PTM05]|uniref:Integral membrane protein n=1 Tax=Streptantibioticus parmotrematis TaxID=2873249 RepID=A0ABS7QNI6_9ACTN|nr:hypothetical protein [Streptantibioticus parmotrematis]MBY8883980.1 hypothetical protein [Streptantibioticus parmotrematis]
MRRPIAAVTAVALVVDACAVAFVNVILGLAVKRQNMSLAGLKPKAMSSGAFGAAVLFGLFLLVCAAFAARAAITDRGPGRVGRIVLVVCAVVHGVLGAFLVGMMGWLAFAAMMVVLALVVATLMSYAPPRPVPADGPPDGSPSPTTG